MFLGQFFLLPNWNGPTMPLSLGVRLTHRNPGIRHVYGGNYTKPMVALLCERSEAISGIQYCDRRVVALKFKRLCVL